MEKSGFVALCGRPNTGKSSIMNALLKEHIAIVTPKAQTTRSRVTGILTQNNAQIVFVDTPGFLQARCDLDRYMISEITSAVDEVDLAILVVNPGREIQGLSGGTGENKEKHPILSYKGKKILLINKIDLAEKNYKLPESELLESFDHVCMASAVTGKGLKELLQVITELLPESPWMYPEDQISTSSERSIVSELIRETILTETQEEIPYGTAVVVDEFVERSPKLYIHAEIAVERESMKSIILGKKGSMIARIGQKSRKKIEEFLQCPVFLELKVKCRHKWRNDPYKMKNLGYSMPKKKKKKRR